MPMHSRISGRFESWVSALSALPLLLAGCAGSAGDGETKAGSENAPAFRVGAEPPSGFFEQEDRALIPSVDPNSPLVDPAAAAYCAEDFQACGGLLAGAWRVEGVCAGAPPDRLTLQHWAQVFMGLDSGACADAVQAVDFRWGGELRFAGGEVLDLRRRSDSAQVSLTRACLSSTFEVSIAADRLDEVCGALVSSSVACTTAGDACQCTVQRERPAEMPRIYGVLGKTVSIGGNEGGPSVIDYCVFGNVLQWREPDTGQLLNLRREPTAL